MNDAASSSSDPGRRRPASTKGKLRGPKPPLRVGHVWSIRARLQLERRVRDLALFNLAIDSKLRGCDLVASASTTWRPTAMQLTGPTSVRGRLAGPFASS